MPVKPDPVATPPSIVGVAGRAWFFDLEAEREKLGVKLGDPHESLILAWIVEAPEANPLWHSYFLGILGLRFIPEDVRIVCVEGATHELQLWALDPRTSRQDALDLKTPLKFLEPKNFAAQMACPNDAAAMQRAEEAVQDICRGVLNPDTDHLSAWIARFGDNMLRKRG